MISNHLQNGEPGLGLLTLAHRPPQHGAQGALITPDEMAALLLQPLGDNPVYASVPLAGAAGGNFTSESDMRTPVASILALVEQILQDDRSNPALQQVKSHAQQLMALMDGLVVPVQFRSTAFCRTDSQLHGGTSAEFSSH